MRNTGQGGRLKTIYPEIFFDILTGKCMYNLRKVFLWYLKLQPIEKYGDVLMQ